MLTIVELVLANPLSMSSKQGHLSVKWSVSSKELLLSLDPIVNDDDKGDDSDDK